MKNELLEKIASAHSNPSVTVSMKTHRTFPDCEKDQIRMKNLFKEASERLTNEFGKKEVSVIIDKMNEISETYDIRHSLDSLHIYLSNEMTEIVKSPWTVDESKVQISERFAIKPLIVMNNRMADYLILILSKSGTKLFKAQNDQMVEEIRNDTFPSTENPYTTVNKIQQSDSDRMDKLLLEYYNTIDKAVVKVHLETGLNCVVMTTDDNFAKLKKVADKPTIYKGYSTFNTNDNSEKAIVTAAWGIVQESQKAKRTAAIAEVQSAVSKGQVLTDLGEIYRAAKEGRADLFVAHNDFRQAVKMTSDTTFYLVDDVTTAGAIDDITSEIAREVIARKGRVVFTNQDEIKDLGVIALKLRF